MAWEPGLYHVSSQAENSQGLGTTSTFTLARHSRDLVLAGVAAWCCSSLGITFGTGTFHPNQQNPSAWHHLCELAPSLGKPALHTFSPSPWGQMTHRAPSPHSFPDCCLARPEVFCQEKGVTHQVVQERGSKMLFLSLFCTQTAKPLALYLPVTWSGPFCQSGTVKWLLFHLVVGVFRGWGSFLRTQYVDTGALPSANQMITWPEAVRISSALILKHLRVLQPDLIPYDPKLSTHLHCSCSLHQGHPDLQVCKPGDATASAPHARSTAGQQPRGQKPLRRPRPCQDSAFLRLKVCL